MGKFKVFKYALEAYEKYYKENYEIYLDLDCTNPLRTSKDISNCISKFRYLKKKRMLVPFLQFVKRERILISTYLSYKKMDP